MILRALAFALPILPGMAWADPPDLVRAVFRCDGGVTVPVVFVNPEAGKAYAVALLEGDLIGMRAAISASGARYRSDDGRQAWQLWVKGDRAMISQGPDGQDRARFGDCLLQQ